MPALFYRVETLNRKTGEWDLRGEYTDSAASDHHQSAYCAKSEI